MPRVSPPREERSSRELERAIARGVAHLSSLRGDDGAWDCDCDAGPASTALALVSLAELGRLEAPVARAALGTLAGLALPDGSFGAHPLAQRGDAATTASALAALSLPEAASLEPERRRAAAWLRAHGGEREVVASLGDGDFSAFFAAARGVISADALPRLPAELVLSARARRWLGRFVHMGAAFTLAQLELLRRALVSGPRRASDRALLGLVLDEVDAVQNPHGSFVNIVPHTALVALVLVRAGVPRSDRRLARAGDWLLGEARPHPRGGLWFPVFRSSLWTTAMTARALARARSPEGLAALASAAEWLLEAQSREPMARSSQPDPGAPLTGGWGFQKYNPRMVDCDDTAVALDALAACKRHGSLPRALTTELHHAARRGLAWLDAMQAHDGGWPAFVAGLPGKPRGPISTRSMRLPRRLPDLRELTELVRSVPYVLGDPATEDVTARVLRARAAHGERGRREERALAFLARMQCADGSLWGRWSTNYLWSTAHVVVGARAQGVSAEARWLRRAVDFLVAHQRPDGGFGETHESYRDPRLKGRGPSMPDVTAVVLEALVAAGQASSAAARAAAGHLVREQRPDGSYPDRGHLQVILPPSSFYAYRASLGFQPVEALAAYRDALAGG